MRLIHRWASRQMMRVRPLRPPYVVGAVHVEVEQDLAGHGVGFGVVGEDAVVGSFTFQVERRFVVAIVFFEEAAVVHGHGAQGVHEDPWSEE